MPGCCDRSQVCYLWAIHIPDAQLSFKTQITPVFIFQKAAKLALNLLPTKLSSKNELKPNCLNISESCQAGDEPAAHQAVL